jgi:hypothetical protein
MNHSRHRAGSTASAGRFDRPDLPRKRRIAACAPYRDCNDSVVGHVPGRLPAPPVRSRVRQARDGMDVAGWGW